MAWLRLVPSAAGEAWIWLLRRSTLLRRCPLIRLPPRREVARTQERFFSTHRRHGGWAGLPRASVLRQRPHQPLHHLNGIIRSQRQGMTPGDGGQLAYKSHRVFRERQATQALETRFLALSEESSGGICAVSRGECYIGVCRARVGMGVGRLMSPMEQCCVGVWVDGGRGPGF